VARRTGGLGSDFLGAFMGQGPIAIVFGTTPYAAIGFVYFAPTPGVKPECQRKVGMSAF
jgi:hypothetical protein